MNRTNHTTRVIKWKRTRKIYGKERREWSTQIMKNDWIWFYCKSFFNEEPEKNVYSFYIGLFSYLYFFSISLLWDNLLSFYKEERYYLTRFVSVLCVVPGLAQKDVSCLSRSSRSNSWWAKLTSLGVKLMASVVEH